jgi:hypothetical protein
MYSPLSPILYAVLALGCVMLTSPTPAAAAPDDRRAPANARSAPAGADSALAGAAPVRDTPAKSERAGERRPPRTGTQSSARSKGLNPAAFAPRRGFDTPAGRPMGSNRAAVGVPVPGSPGASKRNAMPVPKATAVTTNSPIGGPRVQTIGRLGGPAVGRTNHSAAIDGTQFHRKF